VIHLKKIRKGSKWKSQGIITMELLDLQMRLFRDSSEIAEFRMVNKIELVTKNYHLIILKSHSEFSI
jgi:hypothetical protein